MPEMDRIVVAVDPPVTGTKGSDECGIVVVGAVTRGPISDWRAYVLEDRSIGAASPAQWAGAAIVAMRRWGAERLVAEVNQGGDMVTQVIRNLDPSVHVKQVRATKGKYMRAERVYALYEQGRVWHVGEFPLLENQMVAFNPDVGDSPDRVDALVWGVSELITGKRQFFAI